MTAKTPDLSRPDLSRPDLSRPDLSREERLAAKLRENLRRRKEQARALAPGDATPDEPANGLSKSAPKS